MKRCHTQAQLLVRNELLRGKDTYTIVLSNGIKDITILGNLGK